MATVLETVRRTTSLTDLRLPKAWWGAPDALRVLEHLPALATLGSCMPSYAPLVLSTNLQRLYIDVKMADGLHAVLDSGRVRIRELCMQTPSNVADNDAIARHVSLQLLHLRRQYSPSLAAAFTSAHAARIVRDLVGLRSLSLPTPPASPADGVQDACRTLATLGELRELAIDAVDVQRAEELARRTAIGPWEVDLRLPSLTRLDVGGCVVNGSLRALSSLRELKMHAMNQADLVLPEHPFHLHVVSGFQASNGMRVCACAYTMGAGSS
jgi:hypothetical protein